MILLKTCNENNLEVHSSCYMNNKIYSHHAIRSSSTSASAIVCSLSVALTQKSTATRSARLLQVQCEMGSNPQNSLDRKPSGRLPVSSYRIHDTGFLLLISSYSLCHLSGNSDLNVCSPFGHTCVTSPSSSHLHHDQLMQLNTMQTSPNHRNTLEI